MYGLRPMRCAGALPSTTAIKMSGLNKFIYVGLVISQLLTLAAYVVVTAGAGECGTVWVGSRTALILLAPPPPAPSRP